MELKGKGRAEGGDGGRGRVFWGNQHLPNDPERFHCTMKEDIIIIMVVGGGGAEKSADGVSQFHFKSTELWVFWVDGCDDYISSFL